MKEITKKSAYDGNAGCCRRSGQICIINHHERDKALIGTTDINHKGRAEDARANKSEIKYLIDAVNRYFKEQMTRNDVETTFSGMRPLVDNGHGNPAAVARDYVFEIDETGGVPMLNVFGGSITTYHELAGRGLKKMAKIFREMGQDWTKSEPLPGGDMKDADYELFRGHLKADYPRMPRSLRQRYGRLYSTRIAHFVGNTTDLDGLGQHFGGDFYVAEALYLIKQEWAQTAEDTLWRSTKHCLHLTKALQTSFANSSSSTPRQIKCRSRCL